MIFVDETKKTEFFVKVKNNLPKFFMGRIIPVAFVWWLKIQMMQMDFVGSQTIGYKSSNENE